MTRTTCSSNSSPFPGCQEIIEISDSEFAELRESIKARYNNDLTKLKEWLRGKWLKFPYNHSGTYYQFKGFNDWR